MADRAKAWEDLQNPNTSPQRLYEIVVAWPELLTQAVMHPNNYPELIFGVAPGNSATNLGVDITQISANFTATSAASSAIVPPRSVSSNNPPTSQVNPAVAPVNPVIVPGTSAPPPVNQVPPSTNQNLPLTEAQRVATSKNWMGMLAMITGFIGGGIISIIFGFLSLSAAKRGEANNQWTGLLGIALGILWLLITVFFFVSFVIFVNGVGEVGY